MNSLGLFLTLVWSSKLHEINCLRNVLDTSSLTYVHRGYLSGSMNESDEGACILITIRPAAGCGRDLSVDCVCWTYSFDLFGKIYVFLAWS